MSYRVEKADAVRALECIGEYEYVLAYMISRIVLCRAENFDGTDWDECFEARFFDENKELHIYEQDGKKCAVKVSGTADGDCLVKKYALLDQYFGEKKYLCVCEHLGYDEDGQASVLLTRLTGIA